jgi:trk system potassium uptake protein TrkH
MKLPLRDQARTVQQRVRSRQQPRRPFPTAFRLIGGLLLLVIAGTILLLLPGVGTTRRLEINEAAFTATSALSVTGLSIITPVRDLTLFGQIILLCLIQIGGVGFMVGAVIIFRLLGRRVSLLDRLALSDSLGLIVPGAILRLTRQVLVTVFAIEGCGALLLWWNWRDQLGGGRAVFYAIFHAVSAFCNAGFDLFTGLPDYPTGIPKDDATLIIMGALIFLGGLGIPVLADFLTWPRLHRITLHTRITVVVVIVLVCAGGIGMFLGESQPHALLSTVPWPRRLLITFFQSISARTAGFAGVAGIELLTPASQFLLLGLMFIGCAPASMGGGITTGTFAVLTLALWGYARGLPSAQVGGRTIAVWMVRKAAAVLTIAVLVIQTATWLILMTHDAALSDVLFEVISAFATCGLTLAFTDDLNLFGQIVIMFVMAWGRLGALTVILALAQTQQRATQPVTYPEEQILIG